jgi:hypothetical protein
LHTIGSQTYGSNTQARDKQNTVVSAASSFLKAFKRKSASSSESSSRSQNNSNEL